MESSWTQVQSICDQSIDKASPVSALTWDPYFELLWVGNDAGRVSSYYGDGLQRYTSFKAHKNEQVRQIRLTDRGVITLSSTSIQMRDRRGLVRCNVSDENTKDLHTMVFDTPTNTNELMVAGQQEDMIVVNLARGAVTKTVPGVSNIVVMRNTARAVCCGSLLGEVTMRDPRTMRVEQRLQAHTATLSDLDVSGNLLVTCGFSQRQNSLLIDPLVKVYDVRMLMRSLAPIPFPSGPMFVKMHPTLSTTCLVASQSGQFQMCDVSSLTMGSYAPPTQFFQIQSSSYITAMDISSSAHTLAFGDGASFVYQFTDREVFDVNPYSMGLSTPDVVELPEVQMGEDSPLSSVGIPYYTEPLLSNWPLYPSVFDASSPPPHIDDELLKNMKTVDFVGYAPNPGIRRNQAPRKKKPLQNKRNGPKFRSEQEREMLLSNKILDEQDAQQRAEHRASVTDLGAADPMALTMPSYYRRVEIQYSKFGVEDFDFEYYNRTRYGGLETHIRNSFCNSLLQVLYFTEPLRKVATSHIRSVCSHPKCFLCELGFLFRMLEASNGQNCQATNFCRTLTMSPKAAALSLFEPDIPDSTFSYSGLIQSLARFLLEELHGEAFQPEDNNPVISKLLDSPSISTIQQLFGVQTLYAIECASCEQVVKRTTFPFVIDMIYPRSEQKTRKRSFTHLLKGSLCRESKTKAWCSTCRRYRPLTTKRTVLALPNALFINAGTSYPEDEALWRQNGPGSPRNNKQTINSNINNNNSGSNSNSDNGSADTPKSNPWVPERFGVHINGGEVVIKPLLPGSDIPEEFSKSSKTCAIYELAASVVEVKAEDEDPHLVAQVKIPQDELDPSSDSPWYLFNDFLVRSIREEEVLSFKGKWKTPSMLQYKRVDSDEQLDLTGLPNQVDCSILFTDTTVASRPAVDPKYEILTPDEMPKKGTLVALDTEFVALKREVTEIRSDGTKSLIRPSTLLMARLSVIRGEGPKEGVPFIDDYIEITEEVEDYLTEFSGITALDVNPKTTTHTLVDHKMAYAKLRLLVDLGCIFIGHGLVKDFRTINLLVPPEQIIDTVDIYHIRDRQRKISLRFLAWHLLGRDIQSTEGHDSIEDAENALVLYKKYLEYKKSGEFGKILEGVYVAGMRSNWLKKPPRDNLPRLPFSSPRP